MATHFLSDTLWKRIRTLAGRRHRRGWVAVPFVGRGAADRLPLRPGDVLITRCDLATVRAGQVDPREIANYIRRGVRVYSRSNLHAKVFVFGRVGIVGSANVSGTSEEHLIEAGCQITERKLVRECRRFVQGLMGDAVGLEYAKSLAAHYRPPQRGRGRRRASPQHAGLTGIAAVSLELTDYDSVDVEAAKTTRSAALAKINRDGYALDDFRWTGQPPKALRVGNRVLTCTSGYGRIVVAPPARIISVRRYRSTRGAQRAIVVTEVRKYTRGRSLSRVLQALGSAGKPLRGLHGCKVLQSQSLVDRLGQLWATTK